MTAFRWEVLILRGAVPGTREVRLMHHTGRVEIGAVPYAGGYDGADVGYAVEVVESTTYDADRDRWVDHEVATTLGTTGSLSTALATAIEALPTVDAHLERPLDATPGDPARD
ncbi:hypothetical protein [Halomarina pelagica]|uniref:hypothetical protein n=1 Tax=Halomarina pelagica TaxID=2961599 RepID=UPI0020C551D9|nr:hypothetical protein [Halomarina sp. BND7]